MPSIVVNSAPEAVYAAISDLTQHAKWAAHPITIEAAGEGDAQVGSVYNCTHKGKPGDKVTITEMTANSRFGFRSVMPNKVEFQFTMTVSREAGGSRVTRSGKPAKMPGATKLMMLIMPFIMPIAIAGEKKFLRNMKGSLEQASG